jgi:hypothetical protein
MVNGLTNQLTTMVRTSPLGFSPTRARLEKSTATIIGKIIAQISSATRMLTDAYSSVASAAKAPGTALPSRSPATSASATHSDSHFSNRPRPVAADSLTPL